MSTNNDTQSTYMWVVFSNLFFLLPVAYLLHPCQRMHIRDSIHVVLALSIGIMSLLYHLCDMPYGIYGTGGNCVLPFHGLQEMDFTLSVMNAVNIATYRLPLECVWLREIAISTVFISSFLMSQSYDTLVNWQYLLFAIMLMGAVVVFRLYAGLLPLNNYRWPWFVCLGGIGFVLFGLDTVYVSNYDVLHGCWHMMMAFAMVTGFYWLEYTSPVTRWKLDELAVDVDMSVAVDPPPLMSDASWMGGTRHGHRLKHKPTEENQMLLYPHRYNGSVSTSRLRAH